MSLTISFQDTPFGIGDKVRVIQKIKDGDKERTATFEGIVIAIRGHAENRMFTVRKVASGQVGIERIFPIASPHLSKIEVVKKGTAGVRRAKLYYIRKKSQKEIDEIYSRAAGRDKKDAAKKKN